MLEKRKDEFVVLHLELPKNGLAIWMGDTVRCAVVEGMK
jgi:hypothetical protein